MNPACLEFADVGSMSPASGEMCKASLDYMRSPTPESTVNHDWNTQDCYRKRLDTDTPSSPVLSCPPSWLEADGGSNNSGDDGASYPFLEAPLSSSPPDFEISSPSSEDLYDSPSASFISASSRLRPMQEGNGSFIFEDQDLCRDDKDDFSHRLTHLLLEALKEKELDNGFELTDTESDCSLDDQHVEHFGQERSLNFRELTLPPLEPSYTPENENVPVSRPLALTYRIIKRADSHGSSAYNGPSPKRQKFSKDQGVRAQDRVYARRNASLRRADSLRSNAICNSKPDWTSTASAAPTTATSFPTRQGMDQSAGVGKTLTSGVPIIAPPEEYIGKFAQSSETLAKIRLQRYMEREVSGYEHDGFPSGTYIRPSPCSNTAEMIFTFVFDEKMRQYNTPEEWEAMLGIGNVRRHAAVKWLLDILPIKAPGRCPSPQSPIVHPSCSPTSFSSSNSSSSSYTTNRSGSSGPSRPIYNLQDQLENSPETRFHAVWMFIRYFYLTMSPGFSNRKRSHTTSSTLSRDNSLDQDGLNLVVWDVAVACLSISVKFHRDFLHPLLPVFADEYVTLAPHHLSWEDLEAAHRDVLSAFDYRLGITPQPIMDELWFALPSLRALLYFRGGWAAATCKTWRRLLKLLYEPDIQRFLVSVLTVVALMDGILEAFLDHLCDNAALADNRLDCVASKGHAVDQNLRSQLVGTAELEVEGVLCDIQALTGMTDAAVRACRLWMMGRE